MMGYHDLHDVVGSQTLPWRHWWAGRKIENFRDIKTEDIQWLKSLVKLVVSNQSGEDTLGTGYIAKQVMFPVLSERIMVQPVLIL